MKKIMQWFIYGLALCCWPLTVAAQTSLLHKGFSAPTGVAIDQQGRLYVTNWSGNTVVRIGPNGQQTTISTRVSSPSGIAIDAQNNVYVASYSQNNITQIRPNGQQTVFASGYQTPAGLSWALNGDLLINNRASGEVVALNVRTKKNTVLAKGFNLPVGTVQMPNGDLVVSQFGGRLTLVPKSGARKELGAAFTRPAVGIVMDAADAVVVADYGAGALRRVNVNSGATTLLATGLSSPVALAKRADGRYLVSTWGDGSLYLVD